MAEQLPFWPLLTVRVSLRRAGAQASDGQRSDAEPARRGPLLEGVCEPDRARQDTPDRGTVAWLAGRLGVDAGFLETGVPAGERQRVEGAIARAEAAVS